MGSRRRKHGNGRRRNGNFTKMDTMGVGQFVSHIRYIHRQGITLSPAPGVISAKISTEIVFQNLHDFIISLGR